jgi:hypothetical protein
MARKKLSAQINSSGIPIQDMKQAIIFNCDGPVAAGSTKWGRPQQGMQDLLGLLNYDNSDPANGVLFSSTLLPFAGTLKNLYVWVQRGVSLIGLVTVTIFVNGIASAITVSGANVVSANEILLTDLVHSAAFAAGDCISIQIITDAANTSAVDFGGAFELDAS